MTKLKPNEAAERTANGDELMLSGDLPQAPAKSLPEWEDQRVQIVYKMLCDPSFHIPPNREEHWEGWLSRNIVAALFQSFDLELTQAEIMAIGDTVTTLRKMEKSALVLRATHNSGEGDPSVTPDCAGADTYCSEEIKPYPELLMAREAIKALLSLFDDEGNMAATFTEMQKAIWDGYDVLRDTKPSYEVIRASALEIANAAPVLLSSEGSADNWAIFEQAMMMLGDVTGETLLERLSKLQGWYLEMQIMVGELKHKLELAETVNRLSRSHGAKPPSPVTAALPTDDLLSCTVSCGGTEITIQCNDHGVKDRLMNFLTGDGASPWQPIETAPKDGVPVLLKFKDTIPNEREDLRRWDGLIFVGRNHGHVMDWGFAAPVGMGGFPDEWMEGWQALPASQVSRPQHSTEEK